MVALSVAGGVAALLLADERQVLVRDKSKSESKERGGRPNRKKKKMSTFHFARFGTFPCCCLACLVLNDCRSERALDEAFLAGLSVVNERSMLSLASLLACLVACLFLVCLLKLRAALITMIINARKTTN